MKRRDVLAGLLAAATAPRARAQQPARVHRIAVHMSSSAPADINVPACRVFFADASATGRTALLGQYQGSTVANPAVSTWLGYHPDFDGGNMGNQNPNGRGGAFGQGNPGGRGTNAYPWVWAFDIAQTFATVSNRFTYANMASGALDADYNDALNLLTASDIASTYAVRLDHEFEAWNTLRKGFSGGTPQFVSEGPTTCIAAWRRLAGLIKAKMPNVKVIWNPGGAQSYNAFDYTPYYPGGPGSNIDAIGTDGGYFNTRFDGTAANAWLTKFGNSTTTPSINDPKGTLSWFIAFAQSKGVPFCLPEWGDTYQSGTSSTIDTTCISNMCTVINNPANNIALHMYWNSSDALSPPVSAKLSAAGQAIYQAAFANKRYAATFFTFKTPPTNRAGF
jgi:hypothetical protein